MCLSLFLIFVWPPPIMACNPSPPLPAALLFAFLAASSVLLIASSPIILASSLLLSSILLSSYLLAYAPVIAAEWRRLHTHMPRLPPGQMGLPYWGETLEYLRSWRNERNPDIWYDVRKERYGDVFKTHLLGSPTVVLLGPVANKFVFTNENRLFEASWPTSLRELEGRNAVSMVHGVAHKRLRRVLNTLLATEALKTLMPQFEDLIVTQINANWHAGLVYAYPALQQMFFAINAKLFMDLDREQDLRKLRDVYEAFTEGCISQPLNLPWTAFGKAMNARKTLLKYIYHTINQRRRKLSDAAAGFQPRDLLDLLLFASNDDDTGKPFNITEVADNLLLMMHAGQDTISSTLAVVLKCLSDNKDILLQLRKDCGRVAELKEPGDQLTWEELKSIELLRSVIYESMRMCTPVTGTFKQAKCDIVYNGYTIPKGWKVHLALRQTHNKAEYFPDPEKFDPSRFDSRHGTYDFVPFGQGARICPGMNLAKLSMAIFLYHLLVRYDFKMEDPREKIIVRTFFPYPEKGLPLILQAN